MKIIQNQLNKIMLLWIFIFDGVQRIQCYHDSLQLVLLLRTLHYPLVLKLG